MRRVSLRWPREPGRALAVGSGVLATAFLAAFAALWRAVPEEGVKLHGNIDTGIDLLGTRTDLLWIVGTAALVLAVNSTLGVCLRRREPVAALFLLGMTPVVLLGFLGVLLFLFFLNRPP